MPENVVRGNMPRENVTSVLFVCLKQFVCLLSLSLSLSPAS